MKTTAKSLRLDTKAILDAVERGEEVIISKRGKPCARILPIDKKASRINKKETKLFGIWKDNKEVEDVNSFIDSQRAGRHELAR